MTNDKNPVIRLDTGFETGQPDVGEAKAFSRLLTDFSGAVSGLVGDDFLRAITRHLAGHLSMDIVFVGEFENAEQTVMRSRAVWTDGAIAENFSYDLPNTPCADVLGLGVCSWPLGVQAVFPEDSLLQDLGVQGYLGAPLVGANGKVLGILVALKRAPIHNESFVRAAFDLVVGRTAAEIDRMQGQEVMRLLKTAVEQSPVLVVMADQSGLVRWVNPEFEKVTGRSLEMAIGRNLLEDDENNILVLDYRVMYRKLEQEGHWRGEIQFTHKNGKNGWLRANVGPTSGVAGDANGFILIAEDITELKNREKQQRLAATVYDTATEAIMVTDANTRIVSVNRAFTRITGYQDHEVIGERPSILQSGRHERSFYDKMFDTLKQLGSWEGEIWNRRKNGEIYPEWLTITRRFDSDGLFEGYVSVFTDISRRKQDEKHIHQQANYDSLTGLANRRLFLDHFSLAISRAEREGGKVALLFIDLDRFKHVNDILGHSLGDQLLQEAARRLGKGLRKTDTVARLGGDEFAVVLADNVDLYRVETVVRHVLELLAQPYHLSGNDAFVSASIGVTIYPDDGTETESLVRKADSAMYRAKERGRNNFQFFTREMDIAAQERLEMEKALHLALERDEFMVHFQPIVDSATEKVVAAESLVRWLHPEKGLIAPAGCIPLAEEIGLISDIGTRVLEKACRAAVTWPEIDGQKPSVAVNCSSYQFQRQFMPDLITRVLTDTGLEPSRLTIEITESVLVNDDEGILRQLNKIRDMGVGLSIDDFGTGYSSLSYLKKFPISTLKIDRDFVKDLPAAQEEGALVEAMLAMAHALGLKVVAEGVETQEQLEWLASRDCACIQGYWFSKPLPGVDFIEWLNGAKA